MIFNLSRIRRKANRKVYNYRKNVSRCRCGGPERRAIQNVERWRFMSKVSGSRLGIVVVVQINGKNTCVLETVVCNVEGRKVGRRYSAQK